MVFVSAAGAEVKLDIVQGVEFVLDFLQADPNQQNVIDLTGYTFTFILVKKIGNGYSNAPGDRVDWSTYISVLATDTQFGNNHVARMSVPGSQTASLTADATYYYTITSLVNGTTSEWFRGLATVRKEL